MAVFLQAAELSGVEESLRYYLDSGLRPILIHAPTADGGCTCGLTHASAGKHPIAKAWQKPQSLSDLQDQFSRLKFTPNVGIVLGEQRDGQYVVAVDVDDDERFAELVAEFGPLPDTVRGESGRGHRLLFEILGPTADLHNIAGVGGKPGVDLKVKGGQVVVAPSVHSSGKRYTLTRFGALEKLPPAWLLAIQPKHRVPEWASGYTPQTMKEDGRAKKRAEKYLEAAVISSCTLLSETREGSRNTLLHDRAVSLLSLCGGLQLGGKWGWVQDELRRAAKAAGLSEIETRRTIASAEKFVRESGAVRVPVALSDPSPADSKPPEEGAAPSVQSGGTTIQLTMDRGQPAKIAGNVVRYLLQHPDWRGGPQYDTYSQFVIWPDPLPDPIRGIARTHREMVGADRVLIQSWLMQRPDAERVRVETGIVREAMQAAAASNQVDLLTQWIYSLPEWDRVPRIDDWAVKYLGCDDSLYTRSTGRGWLVALIQRAISPGVHIDIIPVLEGKGGVGKNYAIETLFQGGPPWAPWLVTISGMNLEKDETKRLACTRWVMQDDELRSASAGRIESLKSWTSRTMENYRIPYMPDITNAMRRGLLVGSIDRDAYLHDDNVRRWWPWKVGHIKVSALARDRLQLFAEALHCVRHEGQTWRQSITDEAFSRARGEAEGRRVKDPLLEMVANLLRGNQVPTPLTSVGIGKAIGFGVDQIDLAFQMRLSNVMRELEYTKGRADVDGERVRTWVKRS